MTTLPKGNRHSSQKPPDIPLYVNKNKALGGGMRQIGMLAAAGIMCLDEMVSLLERDHKHATILHKGMVSILQDNSVPGTNPILTPLAFIWIYTNNHTTNIPHK